MSSSGFLTTKLSCRKALIKTQKRFKFASKPLLPIHRVGGRLYFFGYIM